MAGQQTPHVSAEEEGEHQAQDALLRDALMSVPLASLMPTVSVNHSFSLTLGRAVAAQDQASTGRCWIFAGINVLRRLMIRRLGLPIAFTLSPAFVYFHSLLEPSNTALEAYYDLATSGASLGGPEFQDELRTRPTDGGDVHDFMALVEKYGVVPRDAYPDSKPAGHTSDINVLVARTLRIAAAELWTPGTSGKQGLSGMMSRPAFDRFKRRVLTHTHRTLFALLGPPPVHFRFDRGGKTDTAGKADARFERDGHEGGGSATAATFTPLEFYHRYVRKLLSPERCVVVADDPRHALHTWIAPARMMRVLPAESGPPAVPITDRVATLLWNVGAADMRSAALACLRAGRAAWFGCDMTHFYSLRLGYCGLEASSMPRLFHGVDTWEMAAAPGDKAVAMSAGIIRTNHEMTFIGHDAATDTWEVENSWGADVPLTMSGAWFARFVSWVCVLDGHLGVAGSRRLRTVGRATLPVVTNASPTGEPLCHSPIHRMTSG